MRTALRRMRPHSVIYGKEDIMPVLIVLGIIVAGIAVAIFKINKIQSDRFIEMAKKAKPAEDADDADESDR